MTFEASHMTPTPENTGVQRVTAGNASGLNDAAAAILIASEDAVKKYGLKPCSRWSPGPGRRGSKIMGTGPSPPPARLWPRPT